MEWWMWIAGGMLLMILEVFTPGAFVALLLGVAAIFTGGYVAVSDFVPIWMQAFLFAMLSVVFTLFLRKPLQKLLQKGDLPAVDQLVGTTAVAAEDLEPNGMGKVELHGASWSARNSSDTLIIRTQRCRVEKVDGLTLYVRAE
jgi:inner membrane protein